MASESAQQQQQQQQITRQDSRQQQSTISATTRLVARPVDYVMDKVLPSAVSNRVRPVYRSYGEPAVEKVDGVLFKVADRSSQILGGARAKLWKVQSQDDVSGMLPRPGLGGRLVAAAERAVDRILPPPCAAPVQQQDPVDGASSEFSSEEDEISSLRRLIALLQIVKMRTRVHAEVRYVMMKVKTQVWFDIHVVRRYQALLSTARSLRLRARTRALALKDAGVASKTKAQNYAVAKYTVAKSRVVAVKDAIVTYEKRAEDHVVAKYTLAKSTVAKCSAAVTTKALTLKMWIARSVQKAMQSVELRLRPYVENLKLRMKPLMDQLNAWARKLREAERKCVADAAQKKHMLTETAKTKISRVEHFISKKYDITSEAAAKYTAQTLGFVQGNVEKVLGRDRSKKMGALFNRYAVMVSSAVRSTAA